MAGAFLSGTLFLSVVTKSKRVVAHPWVAWLLLGVLVVCYWLVEQLNR
ncbi:MAG TPA: hypothetical protein VF384_10530 [Planctomycetota bacterium]